MAGGGRDLTVDMAGGEHGAVRVKRAGLRGRRAGRAVEGGRAAERPHTRRAEVARHRLGIGTRRSRCLERDHVGSKSGSEQVQVRE